MPTYKNYWYGKKVLVTGGTGFIGSFVTEHLVDQNADVTVTTRSNNLTNIRHLKGIKVQTGDLLSQDFAYKCAEGMDAIFHIASYKKNIQYHRIHPAEILRLNIQLSTNILEAARVSNTKKILLMSSGNVYSESSISPSKEEDGFVGDIEEAHFGYGWSKRILEVLATAYRRQYNMKIAIARPFNTYGPRDNFDLDTAQIIPSLIRRIDTDVSRLVIWGDGKQVRSFIYVEDLARAVVTLLEKYPDCDPVNIGSDEEVTIQQVAEMIISIFGKKKGIQYDRDKPQGIRYRNCDNTKIRNLIGFKPKFSLEQGLMKTIEWYKKNIEIDK